MKLPAYSGPFGVGAIDLEIPVRDPRSFGTDHVSNDQINKPRKKQGNLSSLAKESNAKAKQAAHKRNEEGGPDMNADEAHHSAEENKKEEEEENEKKEWDPLTGGAKTTTLHLSTVLFTIFYPTESKKSDEFMPGVPFSNVAWMGRPKRKGVTAFLSYLSQYGPLAVPASPAIISLLNAKIPALAGASLADPSSQKARAPPPHDSVETGNFGSEPAMFPVVIFSHGLAGNRLSYSQFCGELASHGVIVAALEHRDGSGISSIVRMPRSSTTEESNEPEQQRSNRMAQMKVPYFAFEKVGLRSFAEDPSEKEAGLRMAQLAMRSAEIKECLYVLQQIQAGKGEEIAKSSTRGLTSKLGEKVQRGKNKESRSKEEARRLQQWKGKLDTEYPTLCGHSFGGATVIEMQRKGPIVTKTGEKESNEDGKEKGQEGASHSSPFPFSIILDPWVEPIKWREEGEEMDSRPMIKPAFVINSETFTIWRDHFAKLKRIMHDSREANVEDHSGWLFSLAGCQHLDFSDMPFLLPHVFRSTVGPKVTIAIFCRATYAQMGLMRQRRRDEKKLPGAKSEDVKNVKDERKGEKGKEEGVVMTAIAKKSSSAMQNDQSGGMNTIGGTENSEGEDTAVEGGKEQPMAVVESPQQLPRDSQLEANKSESTKDEKSKESNGVEDALSNSAANSEGIPSTLQEKKEEAREKVWKSQSKIEEKLAMDKRKAAIVKERRERGLVAVFANRTPSGNIKVIDDGEESIDFEVRAQDVEANKDAREVHQSLEEISNRLDYKKPKIHSLMAFMFRLKGLHPGIEQPGKVLIHHY